MKLIAILSLLFYAYSFFLAVKELKELIHDNGALTEDHASAHVSIIILYLVTYTSFIIWVYNLADFETFMNFYMIQNSGWFIISLIAWNIVTTMRHFTKEREGKDFILRIKPVKKQQDEKSISQA